MAKKRNKTKKSNKNPKKAKRTAPVILAPPASTASPMLFGGYFGGKTGGQ